MKFSSNTAVLVSAGLLVLAGAYWFFFGQGGNDLPLTAGVENAPQARFAALVGELEPISFDTSIFSNPRFAALVDLATPVAPESSGRLDPFASVPGASAP